MKLAIAIFFAMCLSAQVTEAQRVRGYVDKWSKKLHIPSNVEVELVTIEQLAKLHPGGACAVSLLYRDGPGATGVMYIMAADQYSRPGNFYKKGQPKCDVESTIEEYQENLVVHEFMHFILRNYTDEEQACNNLADALVPLTKEKP